MIDIDDIAQLEAVATPGPWYWGRFHDEHFMSAICVEAYIDNEQGGQSREVVAATLIQQPAYVVPSDDRSNENANLIVAMRNALPGLLRLARIGRASEFGR